MKLKRIMIVASGLALLSLGAMLLYKSNQSRLERSYRSRVDSALAAQVKLDMKNEDYKSTIIEEDLGTGQQRTMARWDDLLVKLKMEGRETIENNARIFTQYHQILTSKDDGKNWSKLIETLDLVCNYGFIHSSKLYCFPFPNESIVLNIVDHDGKIDKRILAKPDVNELVGIYKKAGEVWLVWRDGRAKSQTIYAWIPIPQSALTETGPDIVIAGRFNPDTLEYKEHFLVFDPPPDDFHMESESHDHLSQ